MLLKLTISIILVSQTFAKSEPPKQWDWRDHGAVLTPPDRSGCDANSGIVNALDAMSAVVYNTTGKLFRFSRQQVYDCSDKCPGQDFYMNGTDVYNLIRSTDLIYGVQPESDYKCTNQCNHQCKMIEGPYTVAEFYYTNDNSNEELFGNLEWEVYVRPVVVDVNIDCPEFQTYKSGILRSEACAGQKTSDHTLLLVGFGTEDGVDYWIARNSWGTSWGENGYIRLERNINMLSIGYGTTAPIYV